ncbi:MULTISPECIES: hypothetical protein [unclassified Roseofilum]|uniref:hypothetical protein n=1 Tax=unclassified Roseofilum TaxID=2620099 RepID=UPI000E7DE584|nr:MULTISPECIES: hypothetical protein [unclassified Roseofilum]HBQ97994.1 hypothetical protein [Cyanobacteria bacterium UBA11691]MBP0008215.1 hypothetical protein [Roseofilum sp. Belize Diploria]MBP0015483.1 hypothetical protein [Roseofilum sp. SID3]MBP0023199.1 hypothetical protein [Roseofilum sp. SID2]MBP0039909.1 hypothetical protein [Roseofilum sp. SID1]
MALTPKSGLLLALCCIAAIAATGCIFELSSGTPDLGVSTTSIILAISIPVTGWSFFAAVQDANNNQ